MKSLIASVLAVALTACENYTYGPELSEPGTVSEVCYVPAGHGSGVTIPISSGGGVGVTSVNIPARYATVFACQHGKFVIEGLETWRGLVAGQRVKIIYREVFDESGASVDLDFLRAEADE